MTERSLPATAPGATPAAGWGDVLRNRRFLALWSAQIVSQLAGNAALYALTVLIVEASGGSSTATSLLYLAFLGPAVFLSPLAGIVVDRVDRRGILIWSNVIRAAAFGVIVLLPGQLALAYAMVLVVATATTLFVPAEAAMIPRVAGPGQLLAANGLFTFTIQAAFAAGFAVLGPIAVGIAGPVVTIALVAILYVLATGLCVTLPSARPLSDEPRRHALAELREGLAVIRAEHLVRWPLILLAFTASLIGIVGVIGPTLASSVLGLSAREFFYLVVPIAVGLVVGIASLGILGRIVSRRGLIHLGLGGLTIGIAALALLPELAALMPPVARPALLVAVPVAGVFGASYALVAAPAQTILQESLDDAMRGRVFAVLNSFVSAASALPILLVGPLADTVGIPAVLWAAALACGLLLARSVVAGPRAAAG